MHELFYQEPLGMYRIIKRLYSHRSKAVASPSIQATPSRLQPVHHRAINNRPYCSEGYKELSFS
jgi:hypothetical protein